MAGAEHGWALHGLPAWRSWALSLAFLGEASGSNMEILSMAGWLLQQSDGDLDTSTWTMIHDTFGCLMLFVEVSHGNWGSSVVNKLWGLDCEVRYHHFGCLTCFWQITSLSDFQCQVSMPRLAAAAISSPDLRPSDGLSILGWSNMVPLQLGFMKCIWFSVDLR